MKLRNMTLIFAMCAGLIGTLSSAQAEEGATKRPLDEMFDRTVIVPFDYQGRVFVNGSKVEVYGDYSIVHREGRVMVPIRLMSFLATQADHSRTWEAVWQPSKPEEVQLMNAALKKTITFTVNDRTMLVNNEPREMDVAPQLADGRIVLPLRSAAEALGKHIDWLDGLILIGEEPVHLQHPRTTAVKTRIQTQLEDTRQAIHYQKAVWPLTRIGDASYYIKPIYGQDGGIRTEKLYAKQDGQRTPVAIELPGNPWLSQAKVVGRELYYLSVHNDASFYSDECTLYVYDFHTKQNRKIMDIQWGGMGGWLGDVRYVDESLFLILHYGDGTMGGDTLYRMVNGTLESVVNGHMFLNFVKEGQYLYTLDTMGPHYDPVNNLKRVDLATGEITGAGQPGFAYGIHRVIHNDRGAGSYASSKALYVQDGYLYTLGYKEADKKDVSAVYRINLKDQKQVKLTGPANHFWLENGRIFYTDSNDGKLKAVDAAGGEIYTLTDKRVTNVRFHNGSIYYTVNANHNAYEPGVLYQYMIAWGLEKKRSEQPVTYYVGDAGVYYVMKGYDPGLYRLEQDGGSTRIVKDSIAGAILSDAGMAYTLVYEEGIFSIK
jgi:hypothetical protein